MNARIASLSLLASVVVAGRATEVKADSEGRAGIAVGGVMEMTSDDRELRRMAERRAGEIVPLTPPDTVGRVFRKAAMARSRSGRKRLMAQVAEKEREQQEKRRRAADFLHSVVVEASTLFGVAPGKRGRRKNR